jgi:hypothetical protein
MRLGLDDGPSGLKCILNEGLPGSFRNPCPNVYPALDVLSHVVLQLEPRSG